MAHRVDALLSRSACWSRSRAVDQPYAVLLVVPLVGLFTIFAGERTARVEQAIELSGAYRGTALLLGDVIEADDAYTGQHTQDVVELTVAVADQLGVDDETRRGRGVRRAAARRRQGRDPERDHQQARAARRRGVGDHEDPHGRGPADARDRRRAAREASAWSCVPRTSATTAAATRTGWPARQIPLAARIVSACDAFNAMTTDRSYRKAMSHEVAVAELRNNAGTQFDPDVVEALVAVAVA